MQLARSEALISFCGIFRASAEFGDRSHVMHTCKLWPGKSFYHGSSKLHTIPLVLRILGRLTAGGC